MSLSFLADENISPETAEHLESMGYSCRSLCRDGPRRLSDQEIVALAKREKRIIITQDLDFGQIYYFAEKGRIGVIVLRLRCQTVEMVNNVLERFLRLNPLPVEKMYNSLVILTETTYRVYQGPSGEL